MLEATDQAFQHPSPKCVQLLDTRDVDGDVLGRAGSTGVEFTNPSRVLEWMAIQDPAATSVVGSRPTGRVRVGLVKGHLASSGGKARQE